MSEELKPCPFCGRKAVIHVKDGVCVVCTECGAMTQCFIDTYIQGKPTGKAVKTAIGRWNRRANNGKND